MINSKMLRFKKNSMKLKLVDIESGTRKKRIVLRNKGYYYFIVYS